MTWGWHGTCLGTFGKGGNGQPRWREHEPKEEVGICPLPHACRLRAPCCFSPGLCCQCVLPRAAYPKLPGTADTEVGGRVKVGRAKETRPEQGGGRARENGSNTGTKNTSNIVPKNAPWQGPYRTCHSIPVLLPHTHG